MARQKIGRHNLVTGEETYASQTSQDPLTSRRVQSFIPSASGILERELPNTIKYIDSAMPAKVMQIYQFDRNDGTGNIVRFFFAATSTKLYKSDGAAWVEVSNVGILNGVPMFAKINNTLRMVDGVNNWIFDGSNWVREGFAIPQSPAAIDTSAVGLLSIITNRYYWLTFADQTATRVHESSSGPISAGTSAITNKTVRVYQRAGTATSAAGSAAVVGVATDWKQSDVGMKLYLDGNDLGMIAAVADPTHLTLTTNSIFSVAGGHFVIAPARATHWHIYASESENSKVGFYLASVAIQTMFYDDQSPFIGTAGSLFTQISRPVRNDAAPGSSLLAIHKYRLWRRRDTRPNFFLFSANEEVSSEANGSASESVPGADLNTISDIVNEFSYPDESNFIRLFVSHGDALYMFTEKQGLPLYGETVDDFALSQVTAFSLGAAGKFAGASTPHGLPFMSYDRKLYLYPNMFAFSYVPKDVNVTSQLLEIGRPLRNKFKQILGSDLSNVRVLPYNYGARNWLLVAYQDTSNVYHTWGYDFETKGWFEFSRGFSSLAVLEPTAGNKILVGGATDGFVYVIDDQTGIYSLAGAIYPAAIWRTALIDLGDPEAYKVLQYIEFELTNAALEPSISLNVYLDPVDADNPGIPQKVVFAKVQGANKYRGFLQDGATFNRAMVEILLKSDTNAGAFRTITMVIDDATQLA